MAIVEFDGKSFCFTGKLAELKRTLAEREVRGRNGFSQK
jgi:NAD-dependent DNA ligase